MTTAELFRQAMAMVASAVYVVTGKDDLGRPRGFTATSVSPHAHDPASLMVSIDRSAFSHDALVGGDTFGLMMLAPGQQNSAYLFASKRPDKFQQVEWGWEEGVPVLAGSVGHAICHVDSVVTHGDHTVVIGLVLSTSVASAGPLLSWNRSFHTSPPAPPVETDVQRRRSAMTTAAHTEVAESVLDNVRDLVTGIRERARDTEELGELPGETIDELKAAGLFRLFRPERYGGIEVEWGVQIEAARLLARACGSTGWIAAVVTTHSVMVGRYADQAQQEVWSTDDDVLIATGSARVSGKAVPVDGGFLVDGGWRFASGIDHAQWVIVPAPVEGLEGSGPAVLRQCLIPASEYEIVDDWHVSGLQGTGSKQALLAEPVFVPDHRTLGFLELLGSNPPGADANEHPVYRMELGPAFGTILLGPILGAAEGALEDYLEATRARIGAIFANRIAESVPVQLRVAESAAQIGAAARLVEGITDTLVRRARAGDLLNPRERVETMRDRAWLTRQCVDAVHRLVRQMGASGLSHTNPVQRHFRDISAMAAQIGLNWDRNGGVYGKWALGIPTGDRAIDGDLPAHQEDPSDSVA